MLKMSHHSGVIKKKPFRRQEIGLMEGRKGKLRREPENLHFFHPSERQSDSSSGSG